MFGLQLQSLKFSHNLKQTKSFLSYQLNLPSHLSTNNNNQIQTNTSSNNNFHQHLLLSHPPQPHPNPMNQPPPPQPPPQQPSPQSLTSFQSIYTIRLTDLQQKVNLYCSQYDSLMSLLPIGNQLSSVLNNQANNMFLERMDAKIDSVNERIGGINGGFGVVGGKGDGEKEISDRKLWEEEIGMLEKGLKEMEKEIEGIVKMQEEEMGNGQEDDQQVSDFQQTLHEQKIRPFEQHTSTLLAAHKNLLLHHTNHQSLTSFSSLTSSIEQTLSQHFSPINSALEEIEEQLQIQRLKIPLRDMRKFYQFNFNRLIDEIMWVNERVEGVCGGGEGELGGIRREIERIQYEVKGARRKFQRDLMVVEGNRAFGGLNRNGQDAHLKQSQEIEKDFKELEIGLLNVKNKLQMIDQYLQS